MTTALGSSNLCIIYCQSCPVVDLPMKIKLKRGSRDYHAFITNILVLTKCFFVFSQRTVQETKGWDVFREFPPKQDSGSMESQKCLDFTVRLLKVAAYIIVFIVVLGSGVIAKGTTLFMTSQLKKDRRLAYCNRNLGKFCLQLYFLRIIKIKWVILYWSDYPKKLLVRTPIDVGNRNIVGNQRT